MADLIIWLSTIGLAIGCVWILIIYARMKRPEPTPSVPVRQAPPPPPPPPPAPKPVTAEPVLYMRRWSFLRKKWEADDKAQWDDDFKRLEK